MDGRRRFHGIGRLRWRLEAAALAVALVLPLGVAIRGQVNNYIVGPQDVLAIALYDQKDLSGKYTVEADGTFTFPLIGRVKAGGLTLRDVEEALRIKLSDGFFKNPQVSVAVEQYRSQRVFVMGEVRSPGPYPLVGDMTLIEALARAGSTTEHSGLDAVIIRPPAGVPPPDAAPPDAAVLQQAQDSKDSNLIRIDLQGLQSGTLSQNVTLRAGDTIFVLDEFYESPAGVVEHWRLAGDTWQDLPAFMDWTSKAKKVVTLHSGTVVQGLW